jgi:hypothetical protein
LKVLKTSKNRQQNYRSQHRHFLIAAGSIGSISADTKRIDMCGSKRATTRTTGDSWPALRSTTFLVIPPGFSYVHDQQPLAKQVAETVESKLIFTLFKKNIHSLAVNHVQTTQALTKKLASVKPSVGGIWWIAQRVESRGPRVYIYT